MEARAQSREKREAPQDPKEQVQNFLVCVPKDPRWIEGKSITNEMIRNVKEVFSKYENVEILHAPGEADPQLAFLSRARLVKAIITDDSDLVVYGCRRIIFKLDVLGRCLIYEKSCLKLQIEWPVFRWACILSGCDYVRGGYRGMGLVKAVKFFEALDLKGPFEVEDFENVLRKLPALQNIDMENFIQICKDAERTFRHQHIYDPVDKKIRPLKPIKNLGVEEVYQDQQESKLAESVIIQDSENSKLKIFNLPN
jgi:exonuclease-1